MLQYKCTTPIYCDFRYLLCNLVDIYHVNTVHAKSQGIGISAKKVTIDVSEDRKSLIASWPKQTQRERLIGLRPTKVLVQRDHLQVRHYIRVPKWMKLTLILDVSPQRESTYPLSFLDVTAKWNFRWTILEKLAKPILIYLVHRIVNEDKEFLEAGNHGYYFDQLKPSLRKDHELMLEIHEEFSGPVYGAL